MRILLASDLDKTLIFDNKISEENKDAIRRFKEAGGVFAISTGRPYNGVEKVIEELRVEPDYLILNNGALIITGGEEIVHREFIPFNVVKNIFNDMDNDEVVISVETGFRTYPIDLKSKGAEAAFISDIDSTFKNLELIDKLDEVSEEDKEKIAAISLFLPRVDINEVQAACDYVNDNYGNYVIAYRNTRFIDIVPIGCSKGSGVKWVSDEENIDIKDVYVIGDSWNDDSMFEITDKSFTFTYAEEELKEKTNYIVETVAECIDKYILK